MRFATGTFAFCFIPFALVLGISFWSLRSVVRRSAREELRSDLRDKQTALQRMHANDRLQMSRMLGLAGGNTALRDGLRRWNADPASDGARRTVEDQLRELSDQIGFGLISIEDFKGVPVAWIVRDRNRLEALRGAPPAVRQGVAEYGGQLYRWVSAPIGTEDENPGYISLGEGFDLADFGVPVALLKNGRIVATNLAGAPEPALAEAMAACGISPECDPRIGDGAYLSIRLDDAELGEGYVLRSLQNIDTAAAPPESFLARFFLAASVAAGLAAFAASAGASRSMLRPLATVVSHFHKSEAAGMLVELPPDQGRIVEIRELIDGFNRAASSIREAREGLQAVYVEFAGSLAYALDARDGYTANHSHRVSQIAIAIAQALDLSAGELEAIRIGALLHDIGKIGIPDHVLQKSTVLSDTEFALIRQHPIIGCRILEGVRGFTSYLPVVELHHENWDGTGYPYGLKGKAVPLAARIVHVADAWDAMTSDRPYRRGFTHRRALAVIHANSGTQFDPEIAGVLLRLVQNDAPGGESMLRLSTAAGQPRIAVAADTVYKTLES